MPATFSQSRKDLLALPGANIRRLMARFNMTMQDVIDATGVDERTLRSILHGKTRPHARTLHKLAEGLGIDSDELFQDVLFVENVEFDQATNPQVTAAIHNHPELFEDWTEAEFLELYSRVAVGGELTETGALTAATAMNDRRDLIYQVSVILETPQADVLRDFIGVLFRKVTFNSPASPPSPPAGHQFVLPADTTATNRSSHHPRRIDHAAQGQSTRRE